MLLGDGRAIARRVQTPGYVPGECNDMLSVLRPHGSISCFNNVLLGFNISLQPIQNYTLEYAFVPKTGGEATINLTITWTPPDPSKSGLRI